MLVLAHQFPAGCARPYVGQLGIFLGNASTVIARIWPVAEVSLFVNGQMLSFPYPCPTKGAEDLRHL
jgi:hypothetical protein